MENETKVVAPNQESLTQEQVQTSSEASFLTESEYKACKEQLERVKKQYDYLMADFENTKRRSYVEQQRAVEQAHIAVLKDIVTLVDDFEYALKGMPEQEGKSTVHREGFELIHKAFLALLSRHGVMAIDCYDRFDPLVHEAVMMVQETNKPSGTIIEVFEKGYKYKDVLLRPAKVSVAQ